MARDTATSEGGARPQFLGAVAAGVTLVLAMVPAIYLDEAPPAMLRQYASAGFGGLWVVAGLTIVLVIVFAAGATGRTHPATTAGIGVGIGFILVLVAVLWALSVEEATVAAISADNWFRNHRWLLAPVAALPALVSLWTAFRQELL